MALKYIQERDLPSLDDLGFPLYWERTGDYTLAFTIKHPHALTRGTVTYPRDYPFRPMSIICDDLQINSLIQALPFLGLREWSPALKIGHLMLELSVIIVDVYGDWEL